MTFDTPEFSEDDTHEYTNAEIIHDSASSEVSSTVAMGSHPILNDVQQSGMMSSQQYNAIMNGHMDRDLGQYYDDYALQGLKHSLGQQVVNGKIRMV